MVAISYLLLSLYSKTLHNMEPKKEEKNKLSVLQKDITDSVVSRINELQEMCNGSLHHSEEINGW